MNGLNVNSGCRDVWCRLVWISCRVSLLVVYQTTTLSSTPEPGSSILDVIIIIIMNSISIQQPITAWHGTPAPAGTVRGDHSKMLRYPRPAGERWHHGTMPASRWRSGRINGGVAIAASSASTSREYLVCIHGHRRSSQRGWRLTFLAAVLCPKNNGFALVWGGAAVSQTPGSYAYVSSA